MCNTSTAFAVVETILKGTETRIVPRRRACKEATNKEQSTNAVSSIYLYKSVKYIYKYLWRMVPSCDIRDEGMEVQMGSMRGSFVVCFLFLLCILPPI